MYVKKIMVFEYRCRRFEKSCELLTATAIKFERLMCEVEFWEVFTRMCEGFLHGLLRTHRCWLPNS